MDTPYVLTLPREHAGVSASPPSTGHEPRPTPTRTRTSTNHAGISRNTVGVHVHVLVAVERRRWIVGR